mmetsp:Transcript_21942/g.35483  ORF Transcript_21942/g.35483 Transcript_21942/m.35483 type:complete len:565 (+) Transcript_21942:5-1699(+)
MLSSSKYSRVSLQDDKEGEREGGISLAQALSHDKVEDEVDVPDEDPDVWFSFKTLWAYTGPGWLMSMAYLDPGNLEADLQQGAYCGYQILWVLFWSTVLGWVLQVMAATLGVVTGNDLATHCRLTFSRPVSIILWIMTEIAIVGADIQEVVGSAIAFKLLFNLPLWAGTLITGLDTFTFLGFHYFGIRKLEAFFCSLIFVMCVCFFVNWGVAGTHTEPFLFGWVVPTLPDYVVLQAVATLGAVIMPHNIYLHSALVLSRRVDRGRPAKVREAIKYNAIESAIALLASFFINAAIVVTFARGFFSRDCASQFDTNYACVDSRSSNFDGQTAPSEVASCSSRFDGHGVCAEIGLGSAGSALENFLGNTAKYIWGCGLLASGQASTMTGTYAGQFVMQGFLNIQVAPWLRTMITRTVALGPALVVALATAHDPNLTDQLGEWLNILQSVQLPFALIPVIILTNTPEVMGAFVNKVSTKIVGWTGALMVFAVNVYLIVSFCWDKGSPVPDEAWFKGLVITFLVIYFLFIAYVCVDGTRNASKRTNRDRETSLSGVVQNPELDGKNNDF